MLPCGGLSNPTILRSAVTAGPFLYNLAGKRKSTCRDSVYDAINLLLAASPLVFSLFGFAGVTYDFSVLGVVAYISLLPKRELLTTAKKKLL